MVKQDEDKISCETGLIFFNVNTPNVKHDNNVWYNLTEIDKSKQMGWSKTGVKGNKGEYK